MKWLVRWSHVLQLSPVGSAAPMGLWLTGAITREAAQKNGGLLTCWTRFLLCLPLDYRADFRWPRPGREISARTLWLKDSNQRSEPVKISITQTDLEWTWRLSDSPTCGNKEAHIDSRSTSTAAQARCCFPPFSSVIRASVADAVR